MIAGRQPSQQSQTAGRLHARGFLCLVVVLWLPGDPGHLLVRRNPRRSRARECLACRAEAAVRWIEVLLLLVGVVNASWW